MTHSNLDCR